MKHIQFRSAETDSRLQKINGRRIRQQRSWTCIRKRFDYCNTLLKYRTCTNLSNAFTASDVFIIRKLQSIQNGTAPVIARKRNPTGLDTLRWYALAADTTEDRIQAANTRVRTAPLKRTLLRCAYNTTWKAKRCQLLAASGGYLVATTETKREAAVSDALIHLSGMLCRRTLETFHRSREAFTEQSEDIFFLPRGLLSVITCRFGGGFVVRDGLCLVII